MVAVAKSLTISVSTASRSRRVLRLSSLRLHLLLRIDVAAWNAVGIDTWSGNGGRDIVIGAVL
jgi:hypothetical protein